MSTGGGCEEIRGDVVVQLRLSTGNREAEDADEAYRMDYREQRIRVGAIGVYGGAMGVQSGCNLGKCGDADCLVLEWVEGVADDY
ncbi:uncharacterized protein SPSK_10304 [Sporothrix schenckii 1099-18]|uniref:Uncharacterized protein n=1 Tax=Sporothrix schenckii 1099-18 TaxID=1397361 RepID=A0A0F2M5G0_SPOSC|nr:uncharacterized protein SPSK_10304 [Sporothrix schenckii 1099-18]KJR84020.1 hypothetical protein SPSK_10304 [Sporothrix schenckii 1099-18]